MPVQVYGSTMSYDPSLNLTILTNCEGERSSLTSSAADNSDTILIIPDISLIGKDLGDRTTVGDPDTVVT
jgi:hypothetical protein